jgi:hypothetical protein
LSKNDWSHFPESRGHPLWFTAWWNHH